MILAGMLVRSSRIRRARRSDSLARTQRTTELRSSALGLEESIAEGLGNWQPKLVAVLLQHLHQGLGFRGGVVGQSIQKLFECRPPPSVERVNRPRHSRSIPSAVYLSRSALPPGRATTHGRFALRCGLATHPYSSATDSGPPGRRLPLGGSPRAATVAAAACDGYGTLRAVSSTTRSSSRLPTAASACSN